MHSYHHTSSMTAVIAARHCWAQMPGWLQCDLGLFQLCTFYLSWTQASALAIQMGAGQGQLKLDVKAHRKELQDRAEDR